MPPSRLDAALARAIDTGFLADLYEQLDRESGLPSPMPNLVFAESFGATIAAEGKKAEALVVSLSTANEEFCRVVAAFARASRILAGFDRDRELAALQEIAEDARRHVRTGIVFALRKLIVARGNPMIRALAPFTDGYLQAHLVLEALADRDLLSSIHDGAEVLARLDEAFALADRASRASDRSQGARTLRRQFPRQIALFLARFPETLAWFEDKTTFQRPETREVLTETIAALRKANIGRAAADRLAARVEASEPPPRDPTRIIQGTRKRGRGKGRR